MTLAETLDGIVATTRSMSVFLGREMIEPAVHVRATDVERIKGALDSDAIPYEESEEDRPARGVITARGVKFKWLL